MLEDSFALVETLTSALKSVDSLNTGLRKDRQNLSDAELYEIVEKRAQDVKRSKEELTQIQSQAQELEELMKQTLSNTGSLDAAFNKVKSDIPKCDELIKKA